VDGQLVPGPHGGDAGRARTRHAHLEYNLRTSYTEEDGFGLIVDDGKVKLGAIAVATLAILEHEDRGELTGVREALLRTVEHLANVDGSFRTFYRPPERTDNQNFYPGEALLVWATVYERDPRPELLERILRSFRYYRAWHYENPNPAFVPWHTQAYYKLWRRTGNSNLLGFILDRNDWLLNMQQWDGVRNDDVKGQFYDPKHPEYGPPHASSTGVYLEGLADAFDAAKESGEAERAEAYRLAIARGLRSLMQLQFSDDLDMFYVSKRRRVLERCGRLSTTTRSALITSSTACSPSTRYSGDSVPRTTPRADRAESDEVDFHPQS